MIRSKGKELNSVIISCKGAEQTQYLNLDLNNRVGSVSGWIRLPL